MTATSATPQASVLDDIARLSSAEEIFTFLLLPFRQDVLNVARLHIMKAFGQKLRKIDLDTMDADGAFLAAREALKETYEQFESSSPREQGVLAVFSRTAPKGGNFVPFTALRGPKADPAG